MIARHDAIVRLRAANWVREQDTQEIFKALGGLSDRTRAVGGIVRDTIIGKPDMRADLDLATELKPGEVMARAQAEGMSCYPTGIKHGTVTVRNGQTTVEVTTLREDVETDGRHAQVKFGLNWKADARRRDFTINALYASMTGAFHDPLAGLEDLLAHRVRFIGSPEGRIEEDRLRVYRFFRFTAGYGNEIFDEDGLAACQRAAGSLGGLSGERVGAEMMKILALPRVAATLAVMSKSDIVDIDAAVLEMLARYEDLTVSTVAVGRLAILIAMGGSEAIQQAWRLSNASIAEAREVRQAAALLDAGEYSQAAYRYGRLGPVALQVAAAVGQWPKEKLRVAVEKFHGIDVPPFPINGEDLKEAGFLPGPALGKALRAIEAEWIKSEFSLDRVALLERLAKYFE